MANQNFGPCRRHGVAVAHARELHPREVATFALSALLVALLAFWPVAILLRLAVRL